MTNRDYVLTISADVDPYDEHPDRRLVRLLKVLPGLADLGER
jgi:hypothetical protein